MRKKLQAVTERVRTAQRAGGARTSAVIDVYFFAIHFPRNIIL